MNQINMDTEELLEEAAELLDDIDIDDIDDIDEKFPADGKRMRLKGLKGRDQYVIVDEYGIMITFPDNKMENWNYQATATALTRLISIAQQGGICLEGIKKQLLESSMQKHDTPYILLEAIEKYENE